MPGAPQHSAKPTPIAAVLLVTALCSVGTGVVWNGIPFITRVDYGFDRADNLLLYLFMGVAYVGGAFLSGRIIRSAERIVSPRTALMCITGSQAIVCLGPWVVSGEGSAWIIWVVAGLTSVLSSLLWPTVESYLTSGRHGRAMRSAIGWWNLTWTLSVAMSLVLMAPLVSEEARTARFAIVGLGGLNALATAALCWFRRAPGGHSREESHGHVGPEYRLLLRSARLLLPVSYILLGLISPLLPYLLAGLEVPDRWTTPAAAVWMFARVASVTLMWRLQFWHGRWGTLLLGGSGMVLGFATMTVAPTLPVMLAGLALFGGGQGIVYYAAIYYAMSVGHAAVDAAGTHEGLIGVGYAAGPLVGLGAFVASSAVEGALSPEEMIVLVVAASLPIVIIFAFAPYRRARRGRASRASPSAVANSPTAAHR